MRPEAKDMASAADGTEFESQLDQLLRGSEQGTPSSPLASPVIETEKLVYEVCCEA